MVHPDHCAGSRRLRVSSIVVVLSALAAIGAAAGSGFLPAWGFLPSLAAAEGDPNSETLPEEGGQANETADSPNETVAIPFSRRIAAPSLEGGIAWLNTDKPLAFDQLRGKFVLLDFWTYCCINCIHILPELKKLERAYPNDLVVIGVHSAKFEGEKDTDNIREAILRYEIEHPVVNDAEMTIWNRYGVRSWPSMALVDPEGQLVGITSGEKTFEQLDQLMQFALPYYRKQGLMDGTPIRFALEREKVERTPLLFPGKVHADEKGQRLFIADSNHNRIVVAGFDGRVQQVVGNGSIGRQDGPFTEAAFDHPQGMALVDQMLYVADTENHLLRKVDLAAQQVTTIAGTGVQARGPWPTSAAADGGRVQAKWSGLSRQTPLNSPWALLPHEGMLYIAMAGPHQIWRMPLEVAPTDESRVEIFAGNGREDIVDGPLLPTSPYEEGFSSFAQPSGLATDGQLLYVADTEGSSIRAVPFDSAAEVTTIVGTSQLPGGRLFVFGDRDGEGLLSTAGSPLEFRGDPEQTKGPLLQHAIGVAHHQGKLYVADTYNNKIKVIELADRACRTLAGTGEAGNSDGPAAEATFDEPAGLAVAAGKLFVADTNNHSIRVIDLEQENRVSTLAIEGLSPP
jgi:sugar lactone lactonase YvrE